MYSDKLIARADAANAMARDLAADVLNLMALNTKLAGTLSPQCPPFREARGAIANLSNAALRMWELACAARYEERMAGRGEGGEATPSNVPTVLVPISATLIGAEDTPEGIG